MPNQRGLVPLVPLIAISVAGIAILLILFFSIKSFIPTTPETSLSTQPTPDPTSSSVKNTDFTRVELALDLSKTRAMYCINDQFELINKENEQYKIELRLAQECQKNYEKYSTETTAMRESCIEICESTQSASIKKCEVDVGTADDSDYNFLFCKNDAI